MRGYLRTKFQVCSIILRNRWRGVILPLPPPTSKRNPKKPTQNRVKNWTLHILGLTEISVYILEFLLETLHNNTYLLRLQATVIDFLQSEAAIRGALQKKGVLKNLANFTGKRLHQSLFFK